VNSIDDFTALVRDELGLPVTPQNIGLSLDQLPGWDSVHLLTLLTLLERVTGRAISLPALLDAQSLKNIYSLAVTQ
jgi:acyl carrier protein